MRNSSYYLLLNNEYKVETGFANLNRYFLDGIGVKVEDSHYMELVGEKKCHYLTFVIYARSIEYMNSLELRDESNKNFSIDLLGKIRVLVISRMNNLTNDEMTLFEDDDAGIEISCRVYMNTGIPVAIDVCREQMICE